MAAVRAENLQILVTTIACDLAAPFPHDQDPKPTRPRLVRAMRELQVDDVFHAVAMRGRDL